MALERFFKGYDLFWRRPRNVIMLKCLESHRGRDGRNGLHNQRPTIQLGSTSNSLRMSFLSWSSLVLRTGFRHRGGGLIPHSAPRRSAPLRVASKLRIRRPTVHLGAAISLDVRYPPVVPVGALQMHGTLRRGPPDPCCC